MTILTFSRTVRGERYKLIVHYLRDRTYDPLSDSRESPSWRALESAHAAATLDPSLDARFFGVPRPIVELFDLDRDPLEVNNLADDPGLQKVRERLLGVLEKHMDETGDFLPLPRFELREAARRGL